MNLKTKAMMDSCIIQIKKENEDTVTIECPIDEYEKPISKILFADKKSKRIKDAEERESQFSYVIIDSQENPHTYIITEFLWYYIGDFLFTHNYAYIQVFRKNDYKSMLEFVKYMMRASF